MRKLLSFFLAAFLMLTMSCTAYADTNIGVDPGKPVPDFTVTTTDGETVTLSELLKEKDLVVLNIFASWCGPCENEFPEMEEYYKEHSDKMEIVALSGDPEDTMEMISEYKDSHSLTFPMGLVNEDLSYLRVPGYPTSIFIDRNGNVGFIKVGSFSDKEAFEEKANYFLAPDYDGTPLKTEEAKSLLPIILGYIVISTILTVIGRWLLFSKAGQPAWHSLIPVLNTYKEYKLCWNGWMGLVESVLIYVPLVIAAVVPGTTIVMLLVPRAFKFVLRLVEGIKLSKAYGKGVGYGIFLAVFHAIGRLVLGFSKAQYQKEVAV